MYNNHRIAAGIIAAMSLLLGISAIHNYRQYQELERLRGVHMLLPPPPPAPPAPIHMYEAEAVFPANLEAVRREIELEKSLLKAEVEMELAKVREELDFLR